MDERSAETQHGRIVGGLLLPREVLVGAWVPRARALEALEAGTTRHVVIPRGGRAHLAFVAGLGPVHLQPGLAELGVRLRGLGDPRDASYDSPWLREVLEAEGVAPVPGNVHWLVADDGAIEAWVPVHALGRRRCEQRPRAGGTARSRDEVTRVSSAVMTDYGEPTSFLEIDRGVDVISSDGQRVGALEHVLADEQADIFDGVTIDIATGPGGHRFVDAPQVAEFHERAVLLGITADEVDSLPEPSANPAVIEHEAGEDTDGPLAQKLRRAWDLISGRY